MLSRVAELTARDDGDFTGLPSKHPLRLYLKDETPDLKRFLSLDDSSIWGSLTILESAKCDHVSELARRLYHRDLYKCVDVGAYAKSIGGDAIPRFRKKHRESYSDKNLTGIDVLEDHAKVSPYKLREYESPNALSKILIRKPDGSSGHEDIAHISPVVGALKEEDIFRVYARNTQVKEKLDHIWKEVKG